MEKIKQELLEFVRSAGKMLNEKCGKVADIGVTKTYLTEYDLSIEREIKKIVTQDGSQFFAEEENDNFTNAPSVWVADPISGTSRFIKGTGNYAIVVSHLRNGKVDYAAAYNPTQDKLYIAENKTVTLNGKQINPTSNGKRIIFAIGGLSEQDGVNKTSFARESIEKLRAELKKDYELFEPQGSFAYNYCLVAEGLFDGVVSITKDCFPEFAGLHIANTSGVIATNVYGEKDITQKDRIFVCGHKGIHADLLNKNKMLLI